jgi:hypothetical protein
MKRLQEASRVTLDPETMKRLQEASRVTLDPETMKRLQEASRITLDPEVFSRARASLSIPLSQLRSLSAGVALELDQGSSDPVTRFAGALLEEPERELASEWLAALGTTRQRRLLLLALAAITAVLDAVDAETNVQPPAHLILIIYALISVAVLLNEAIDRPGG